VGGNHADDLAAQALLRRLAVDCACGLRRRRGSSLLQIGGRTSSSAAETATKDVLALNTMMFQLYGASGAIFRKNLMDHHPIILGLFTGAGGRFILYRPG